MHLKKLEILLIKAAHIYGSEACYRIVIGEKRVWHRTLKKLRTLKFFSKCVKIGTKSTHFKIFFQSALNLGPTQRTLKKNFKVR